MHDGLRPSTSTSTGATRSEGRTRLELEVAGTQYTLTGPTTTPGNWIATGIRGPAPGPGRPDPRQGRLEWEYKGPGTSQGNDCTKGSGLPAVRNHQCARMLPTDNGSDYDALTAVKLTTFRVVRREALGEAHQHCRRPQTYSGILASASSRRSHSADFAVSGSEAASGTTRSSATRVSRRRRRRTRRLRSTSAASRRTTGSR